MSSWVVFRVATDFLDQLWFGVLDPSEPRRTTVDLELDDSMIAWGFPVAIFHCPSTRIRYGCSTISKMDQLFVDRCTQKALLFSVDLRRTSPRKEYTATVKSNNIPTFTIHDGANHLIP